MLARERRLPRLREMPRARLIVRIGYLAVLLAALAPDRVSRATWAVGGAYI